MRLDVSLSRTVYPGLLTTFMLVPALAFSGLTLGLAVLGFLRGWAYWVAAGYFACSTAVAWHVTLWLYARDRR